MKGAVDGPPRYHHPTYCKDEVFVIEKGFCGNRNMNRTEIKPRMLSIDQTARYVGLASKTIRNRIGPRAKVPFPVRPKRIGGRVLFDVKDLDAYLDGLPIT